MYKRNSPVEGLNNFGRIAGNAGVQPVNVSEMVEVSLATTGLGR